MAIRDIFLLVMLGLWSILALGAFAPGVAAPLFDDTAAVEAAIPQSPEEPARPDLLVEPSASDEGSWDAPLTSLSHALSASDLSRAVTSEFGPVSLGETAELGVIGLAMEPPSYPLVLNEHVRHFVDRFTGSRREVIGLWFNRSGRYLGMIREVLRGHGLPEDLAFTAMIESGFNPLAVSRAGAKGLWQFMAGTARRYGLRVDQWVDERFDPEKSTVAAAAYLRDLYRLFGSWSLAQAAYNAGELRVIRAIRATGSTDFWALARTGLLKRETKEFVPMIQAATVIGRDPDRYGFEPGEEVSAEVETVAVPASTDLRRLAKASRLSIESLRALNAELIRGVTPPGAPYRVKIPAGTGPEILAALAPPRVVAAKNVQAVRAAGGAEIHIVRPRDTVSGIAKRYGVSVSDLVRWNGLEQQEHIIRPGDRLRIAGLRATADRRDAR